MIIVDNKINFIINLLLITNVNSILMIEQQYVPSINVHDKEKVGNQSNINRGIPIPYKKQVRVIPFGNEQMYRKNSPFSSGSSLIT